MEICKDFIIGQPAHCIQMKTLTRGSHIMIFRLLPSKEEREQRGKESHESKDSLCKG